MTVEELKSLVHEAAGTQEDPLALLNLFHKLGPDVEVDGATLREALNGTSLEPPDETSRKALDNVVKVTKKDDTVVVENKQRFKGELQGMKVELSKLIRFKVGMDKSLPTVSRLRGVRVDSGKLGMVEPSRIQIDKNAKGEQILRVAANKGSLPLPLVELPLPKARSA